VVHAGLASLYWFGCCFLPDGGETSMTDPIFKPIFGAHWDSLPLVIKRHYANRPCSRDRVIVEGVLDVMCAGPVKAFSWLFWGMGGIPPHNEKDVPVTVVFESDENSKSFFFNRSFQFKTVPFYQFRSRMVQISGDEVVEIMRFGIGWRMSYRFEDGRVKLKHKGYVLHVFGTFIPLPLTMLMGEGYAEEIATSDDSFDMFVHIIHPWWGKIYEYRGHFNIREDA
jgi:hypothetical protein